MVLRRVAVKGTGRLPGLRSTAASPSLSLIHISNGLDEKKIANMELYEHAHFDSYGVGENLITSALSLIHI